jgi:hypothetical protein
MPVLTSLVDAKSMVLSIRHGEIDMNSKQVNGEYAVSNGGYAVSNGGYAVSSGEYSGDLKGTYQIGGMPV